MRTTVDIPDPIYRKLKARAAIEGSSVKHLVLQGVEIELGEQRPKRIRRVKLPIVRSKKPSSLRLDNARIYEVIPFP
jgi:hypothetical protein